MKLQAMQFNKFHQVSEILQTLDIGLIVVDRDFHVTFWNQFMENHSGLQLSELQAGTIFHYFPELDRSWLQQKLESVFTLRCTSFISWELRPYLFRFAADRPFTGTSDFMYQNISIIPLSSEQNEITHVCLTIYDVTDAATSKMALENVNQQLTLLSITDKLTGLYNRGYWEECLRNEFNRFARTKRISTLMMLDIDLFKVVNDTYGHLAGDAVLRSTSQILQQCIRKTDIAGRYGGEEFGLILLDTPEHKALIVAERFRAAMERHTIDYQGQSIRCTVSIGLAELQESYTQMEDWLHQADKALYCSKRSGRNQISLTAAVTSLTTE